MTHLGIVCAVRDCDEISTHELLTPDGVPFFGHEGEGLYICDDHADLAVACCSEAREITVNDDGNVEVVE